MQDDFKHFCLSITDDLMDIVEIASNGHQISKSAWIRIAIREKYTRDADKDQLVKYVMRDK